MIEIKTATRSTLTSSAEAWSAARPTHAAPLARFGLSLQNNTCCGNSYEKRLFVDRHNEARTFTSCPCVYYNFTLYLESTSYMAFDSLVSFVPFSIRQNVIESIRCVILNIKYKKKTPLIFFLSPINNNNYILGNVVINVIW